MGVLQSNGERRLEILSLFIDIRKELLNKELEKLAPERGFNIEPTIGYTPERLKLPTRLC
jgi:hypothetical protein